VWAVRCAAIYNGDNIYTVNCTVNHDDHRYYEDDHDHHPGQHARA